MVCASVGPCHMHMCVCVCVLAHAICVLVMVLGEGVRLRGGAGLEMFARTYGCTHCV